MKAETNENGVIFITEIAVILAKFFILWVTLLVMKEHGLDNTFKGIALTVYIFWIAFPFVRKAIRKFDNT